MAHRELMTPLSASKRWVKKDEGKQVYIGYKRLKKEFPDLVTAETKEGTREAANAWWERRQANRTPDTSELDQAIDVVNIQIKVAELAGDNLHAYALRDDLRKLQIERTNPNPRKPHPASLVLPQFVDPVNQAVFDDRLARLRQSEKATEQDRTIQHQVEAFLALKRRAVEAGNLTPDRWEVLRVHTDIFQNVAIGSSDVSSINEQRILDFYLNLTAKVTSKKFAAAYAHDVFGTFKAFVRHLWSLRLIQLPRNLDDRKLIFNRKNKVPQVWTKDEFDRFLGSAAPRTKLFGLLMLNCGFYGIDIATLEQDMVDWKAGRIIRKRHKEQDTENAPVVNWLLWPETLRLLKEHRSKDKRLVLVNEDGKPLRVATLEDRNDGKGDKFRKSDNIRSAVSRTMRKLKIKKSPSDLRKTGPSKLEEHDVYGRYSQHFLGQAPDSVAGKHYVVPSQEQLDRAIVWLQKQFGI